MNLSRIVNIDETHIYTRIDVDHTATQATPHPGTVSVVCSVCVPRAPPWRMMKKQLMWPTINGGATQAILSNDRLVVAMMNDTGVRKIRTSGLRRSQDPHLRPFRPYRPPKSTTLITGDLYTMWRRLHPTHDSSVIFDEEQWWQHRQQQSR